ncbi:hypothetical protein TURU_083981 [Turdus rufiventris]|nr:hypothetical protein TURU_083981 [Turdus rufiventris]
MPLEPGGKYIVTGDTNHIPSEIKIVLVTLLANPSGLVLLACCIHAPFYLARGQVIAQDIPIPAKIPVDDQAPEVYWAEAVADALCFAFSVPSKNQEAPMRRFHWKVLPQGMKASPTICKWYIASLLSPEEAMFPRSALIGICFILIALNQSSDAWIIPQPRKNVWVTLAEALKQDHVCLSTAAAENPMSTCLVGVPFKPEEYPERTSKNRKQ